MDGGNDGGGLLGVGTTAGEFASSMVEGRGEAKE